MATIVCYSRESSQRVQWQIAMYSSENWAQDVPRIQISLFYDEQDFQVTFIKISNLIWDTLYFTYIIMPIWLITLWINLLKQSWYFFLQILPDILLERLQLIINYCLYLKCTQIARVCLHLFLERSFVNIQSRKQFSHVFFTSKLKSVSRLKVSFKKIRNIIIFLFSNKQKLYLLHKAYYEKLQNFFLKDY